MKKFRGIKICVQGASCKGTCISRLKQCRPEVDKEVVKAAVIKLKSAPERLIESKPKSLEARLSSKRGIKRIQYVSQDDVLRALGVYKKDVLAIKEGKAPHPYINMTSPSKEAVDQLYEKIKTGNRGLYEKLSSLGIRKDGSGKNLSTSEKVRTAITVYLQQDGRSFATGKAVSINKLSLDHIVPLSAGGNNSASNLVLIESNINYVKGNRSLKDFGLNLEKKAKQVNTPEDLERFKAAILAGDTKKIASIQKELQVNNRVARLNADKKQAQIAIEGAKAKDVALSAYGAKNELGIKAYARYNNLESISNLSARELKNIAKAQSLGGDGIARWYRSPGNKGSQVDYPTGDALKAQLLLNNGVKWRDIPLSWREAFKEKFIENTNQSGSVKIVNAYKNVEGIPEWLK